MRTGANGFEANKFMLQNSTAWNYATNEDIRYELFDKVDFWALFKDASGYISVTDAQNRTLNAFIYGANLFLVTFVSLCSIL